MLSLKKFVTSLPYFLALAMVAICFSMGAPAGAQETLSTDLGVDITAWVSTVAAAFGALVGAVLGVYFLIQIVKAGMQWIRRFAAK